MGRKTFIDRRMKPSNILIKNIYYMLAYAYRALRHERYENIATEDFEHIHDLFACILSKGIAEQLKRGLGREYVERCDNIPTVRGKIDIPASTQECLRRTRRLVCRYDELSENSPMNRILKTTAMRLIRHGNVSDDNKNALKKSLRFFSSVEELEPSCIDWTTLRYHRNNYTYRMLMNICEMTLQNLLLSQEKGQKNLTSFLFDETQMCRLFEEFVLQFYKKECAVFSPRREQIRWNVDGHNVYLPVMKTDIVLHSPHDKNEKLIIDTKYSGKIMQEHYDSKSLKSVDLYQIFAYVKNEDRYNTGKVSGMLLYAKTTEDIIPDYEYSLCGNKFFVKTLDLNMQFDEIKMQLKSIAKQWQDSCHNRIHVTAVTRHRVHSL